MFESYHTFTTRHRSVLKKYLATNEHSKDGNLKKTLSTVVARESKEVQLDEFYRVLQERVNARLRECGLDPLIDRCASFSRIAYYIFIFVCLVFSIVLHCQGRLLFSFLSGVFGWLLGALGHDGGHFTVHRCATINRISKWGMSLLCNPVSFLKVSKIKTILNS